MGTTNIPSLPVAIALDGTELLWIVQGGATDKRCTTGQIAFLGAGITPAGARPQRSITSITSLPLRVSDAILNCNLAAPLTVTVLASQPRNGLAFTFKVLPASGNSLTLIPTGTDTFDGQTSLVVPPGASVTLMPYNDGVNLGYGIE